MLNNLKIRKKVGILFGSSNFSLYLCTIKLKTNTIMTESYFKYVKNNFHLFKGVKVEFKYYIPSADRFGIAKGILVRVGTGCNSDCLIISERGKNHAIYYENVVVKGTWELHIYWEDGATIECRYFPSKEAAEKYAKDNGITNYKID